MKKTTYIKPNTTVNYVEVSQMLATSIEDTNEIGVLDGIDDGTTEAGVRGSIWSSGFEY